MAKPTGAINATSGSEDGGLVANRDLKYLTLSMLVPQQSIHWRTTSSWVPKTSVAACATVASSVTIDFLNVFGAPGFEASITGSSTAAWKDLDDLHIEGDECLVPSPIDDESMRKYLVRISIEGDVTQSEVLGLYFEQSHDNSYTGPSPAGELNFEMTGSDAQLYYAADYPATAHIAQNLLCHNTNRLAYNAVQVWSVPL